MAEEEELEQELEEQLVEHNASLEALEGAIRQDPGNQELLSLREDLVAAVKEVEESLLPLKRRRLLLQIDSSKELSERKHEEQEKQEQEIEKEDEEGAEEQRFVAGSKCRFRHIDGRWYNGKVLDLCKGGTNARVSFLTPTNENMQICRFFLQQRCRYGESCRSSHGFMLQLSSLKEFPGTRWEEIEVGSTVLACSSADGTGIWRDAEVENLVEHLRVAGVVFTDDGSRTMLGTENLILSEHAAAAESSSSSSSSSDDSGDEETLPGIGTISGFQQTETAIFASWEKHTRGVASKIMAKMGYKQGTGLGRSGQGLVAPLQVRVLPPKTSLGFVSESATTTAAGNSSAKKKSRGGKRKREKKFAEARRARKAEEEAEAAADVFDFINVQLAAAATPAEAAGGRGKAAAAAAAGGKPKEDRRSMVRQQDEIKELASRVAKLEEMAHRNRKDKSIHEGVKRKLSEARKALSDAEAALHSTTHAVRSKEQEKRWLRF